MADPVATLEYVRAHLEDALATDARVAQGGLRVGIEGAGLVITGSVPTRDRHDAVSVVAAEVASGFAVHNATEPVPLGSPVASEEL